VTQDPGLAIEEAFAAYLTPPRYPETAREAELTASAERSRALVGEEWIEVYSWGAGRPVLLVHGWGGRATHMGAFVSPLVAHGYRVVAFDAPAHGRSEGTQSSGLKIAASIGAIGRAQGEFAGVVAHSIGATATALALRRGFRADRVVLLGTCCWVLPTLEGFARRRKLPPDVEEALMERFHREYRAEDTSVDLIAPDLSVPALLLHDPADAEVSYEHAAAAACAWRGSRLVELPGVGHRRILRARAAIDLALQFLADGAPLPERRISPRRGRDAG
jgi:pimeloyl-ACP methyl ester carboxylesterase